MGRSFREEKRLYTRKARQTLNACLDEIAPGEAETILSHRWLNQSLKKYYRFLTDGMYCRMF